MVSASGRQAHDAPEGRDLLESWADLIADAPLAMDRACEGDETRQLVRDIGMTPVVPPKANRKVKWNCDRETYKMRNEIERLFRRFKGCRRIFTRAALLVVDEIGYLPISKGGASLFFQIVNAGCKKGATISTSNRSFAEWGDIFGDPVVATALHHHAVVVRIEGASCRPGKHADLIPEHVRANAPITPPPAPKKRERPKKETRTDD